MASNAILVNKLGSVEFLGPPNNGSRLEGETGPGSPGANMQYATNAAGAKAWYARDIETGATIRDKLTTLAGDDRLDASAIKNIPGGGGGGYSWFSAGNGGYVMATGAGVTFTLNGTTGEAVFTVPDGVDIKGGVVRIASGDTDGNNDLFLALNFGGTRDFNQGIATARKPHIEVSNGSATPSRAAPNFKSNTIQTGITAVGSNNIEVVLDDVGTTFPNILITFVLP